MILSTLFFHTSAFAESVGFSSELNSICRTITLDKRSKFETEYYQSMLTEAKGDLSRMIDLNQKKELQVLTYVSRPWPEQLASSTSLAKQFIFWTSILINFSDRFALGDAQISMVKKYFKEPKLHAFKFNEFIYELDQTLAKFKLIISNPNEFKGPQEIDIIDSSNEEPFDVSNGLKKYSSFFNYGACIDLLGVTKDALDCANALKVLTTELSYDDAGNLPVPSMAPFNEFFSTQRYHAGFIELARLMLKKVSNQDSSSSLITDIFRAFHNTGLERQDAAHATWLVIAMISSRGENTFKFDPHNYLNPYPNQLHYLKFAYTIISNAIAPLTSFTREQKKRLYVFPRRLPITCDTGKPYHFWYPVYLSQKLGLKKLQGRGVKAAIFLVSVAYNLLGRYPEDIEMAFTKGRNTLDAKKTVIDLSMAAAGIHYASLKEGVPDYTLNDRFLKLLQQNSDAPVWSNEKFSNVKIIIFNKYYGDENIWVHNTKKAVALLEWKHQFYAIFNPKQIFNEFVPE